jgi:HlyD family secretion protein
MRNVLRIGVVVLVAAVALRLTVFRPRPLAVEAVSAAWGPVQDAVTNSESGTIKVRTRARLSVERAGTVAALPYREGAKVARGAPLVVLDSTTAVAHRDAARRDLDAAVAAHESAHAAEVLASRLLTRTQELRARGMAAEAALDEARSRADVARAEMRLTEARVESARAAVRVATDELSHMMVLAPFAGVIARRNVDLGESVTPGQVVIELFDPGRPYVSCPIDERDAGRLREGLSARVTIDTYPGQSWRGHVRWVAPLVEEAREQNRTLEVEIDLDPAVKLPDLRPGLTADAEIVLARKDRALRIPAGALLEGPRVMVVSAGRAESRRVSTGLRDWNWVEIRTGLAAGEPVITSLDRPGLKPGARVAPTFMAEPRAP